MVEDDRSRKEKLLVNDAATADDISKIKGDIKKIDDNQVKLVSSLESLKKELTENVEKSLGKEVAKLVTIAEKRKQDDEKFVKDINNAAKALPGIREFVRETLSQIMYGVDDAAAIGKTRELDEGLVGYLPSVSAIGSDTVEDHSVERVEFDLVVVHSAANAEEKKQSGNLKVVANWLPLRLAASGQIEQAHSQAVSNESTNRVRFAVPYHIRGSKQPDECIAPAS